MRLFSIASLVGLASLTCACAAVSPEYSSPALEPVAYALSPVDKGDYRDQDIATVTGFLGQRNMSDDTAWKPVDEQFTLGMQFDTYRPDDWFGIEAGFMYAKDESNGALGQTTEIFLGARKTFTIGETTWHPYLGIGASFIWSTFAIDAAPAAPGLLLGDSDESFGFYAHGGVFYTLGRTNIGVDLRTLQGTDISLAGVSSDGDYVQFGLTVGYGF